MAYLYLKALHIIFVVTWFSGLFYIVRLFIYHTEATLKPKQVSDVLIPQYKLMAKRLWYIITWPSAIITLLLGYSLLHHYLPTPPTWLWIKVGFVAGLFLYQLYCHRIFKNLQNDVYKLSGQQLRIWNEIATLFLFCIVFLVVLKSALNMLWGIFGLIILMAVLMTAIKLYKKFRSTEN